MYITNNYVIKVGGGYGREHSGEQERQQYLISLDVGSPLLLPQVELSRGL